MKFGLRVKIANAISENRFDEFIEEISPLEKLDIIRQLSEADDASFRTVDASSICDRYTVYTDVLKMSLTQFILLETSIKSLASESDIALIIIRPKDELEFDNTDQEKEEELISSIYEEDGMAISYIIKSMLNNREYILFTKFDGVIYNKVEKSDEDEDEEDEVVDSSIDFNERWFWYSIVRSLANEDLTKFQFVYDMKMSDVLVELAYRVQLAQKNENERRAEEARRR